MVPLFIVILGLVLLPQGAQAYLGPGLGLSGLGQVAAFLLFLFLSLGSLVSYSVRVLWSRRPGSKERVLVKKSGLHTDLQHYQREGVTKPFSIPESSLKSLREAFETLVENNQGKVGQINYSLFNNGTHPLNLKIDRDWLDLLNIPEIFDVAEDLIGPNIAAWAVMTFRKDPGDLEVGWHQGGPFWPIVPLKAVTVWIALDDANQENGCMQYIPGSHAKNRLYPHRPSERDTLPQHIPDDELNVTEVKSIELKAGQAVIFQGTHLVHRSLRNSSNRPRRAVVLRLMPTTSYWDHQLGAEMDKTLNKISYLQNMPLRLMRGVDVCGRNKFQERS